MHHPPGPATADLDREAHPAVAEVRASAQHAAAPTPAELAAAPVELPQFEARLPQSPADPEKAEAQAAAIDVASAPSAVVEAAAR